MSLFPSPTLPMPTKAEILELVTFLAANVSVCEDDGKHEKAERYRALQNTVQALAERVAASAASNTQESPEFVVVALRRTPHSCGMEPGSTYGPFTTKGEAIKAAEAMDFPSPEWVYIRQLYPR